MPQRLAAVRTVIYPASATPGRVAVYCDRSFDRNKLRTSRMGSRLPGGAFPPRPQLKTGNISRSPNGGDFGILQTASGRHSPSRGDKLRGSGALAASFGANDIAFGTDPECQWLVDCDRLDVLYLIGSLHIFLALNYNDKNHVI